MLDGSGSYFIVYTSIQEKKYPSMCSMMETDPLRYSPFETGLAAEVTTHSILMLKIGDTHPTRICDVKT
jgi:hypothetical protein